MIPVSFKSLCAYQKKMKKMVVLGPWWTQPCGLPEFHQADPERSARAPGGTTGQRPSRPASPDNITHNIISVSDIV